MNTKPLFLSIALAFTAPMVAQADILSIGMNPQILMKANTPNHGDSMSNVAKKYGAAKRVKTSKGAVTKRNPKITQWDYPSFSVYFENSHVIHSVIHR